MRLPLARRPAPEPTAPTLEEAVEAACAAADAAARALAQALQNRAVALTAFQRTHRRHPAAPLVGKALGNASVEQALAAAGVAAFTSLFVNTKARRSFVQQARGFLARGPTQQPKEG
jgi:hypothetical protein